MSKPAALVTVLEVQKSTTADLIKEVFCRAPGSECFIPATQILVLIYGGLHSA